MNSSENISIDQFLRQKIRNNNVPGTRKRRNKIIKIKVKLSGKSHNVSIQDISKCHKKSHNVSYSQQNSKTEKELLLEKLQKDFIEQSKIISVDNSGQKPKKSSDQKKRITYKPKIKPFNHILPKKFAKMVERILNPRSTRNQKQRIVERIFNS